MQAYSCHVLDFNETGYIMYILALKYKAYLELVSECLFSGIKQKKNIHVGWMLRRMHSMIFKDKALQFRDAYSKYQCSNVLHTKPSMDNYYIQKCIIHKPSKNDLKH
jgi:hypothetical protein